MVKLVVGLWLCWLGRCQRCYLVRESFNYCFDFLDFWSWLANMDFVYSFDFSHIPKWSTPLLGIIHLSQISNVLLDITSPLLVAISHSCTCGNSPTKKYWHWCHFSYLWCRHFRSSPLNHSHASKNYSSSLWINSEISLRIRGGQFRIQNSIGFWIIRIEKN